MQELKRQYTQKPSCLAIAAIAMIVVTGCQTTGDPTQGGLFGWDEKKAVQRQQALKSQAENKQAEAIEAEEDVARLEGENAQLKSRIVTKRAALTALIAEHQQLSEQLNALKRQNRITNAELEGLYTRFPWLTKTREEVESAFQQAKQASIFDQQMASLENNNKALLEEIILLIGR